MILYAYAFVLILGIGYRLIQIVHGHSLGMSHALGGVWFLPAADRNEFEALGTLERV